MVGFFVAGYLLSLTNSRSRVWAAVSFNLPVLASSSRLAASRLCARLNCGFGCSTRTVGSVFCISELI
jgi:hypothetical protein